MKIKLITAINIALINREWYPKLVKEGSNNIWRTYCNKAVRFICEHMGVSLPHSAILANDIYDYLNGPKSNGIWIEVDYKQAFEQAKNGELIVVAQKGTPNGHVAILYPVENMQYSWTFKQNVPIVFNMGLTVGIVKLSYAFKTDPKPKMYLFNKQRKEEV